MSKHRLVSLNDRLAEKREIAKRYRESIGHVIDKRFIAWDGEGFNDGQGIHKYGLLMNSLDTTQYESYMYSFEGLSSVECFNFLCDAAKGYLGETSVHVCFSANYDTNMMLKGSSRDIPKQKLVKLYEGESVVWNNFSLTWRPRKSFTIGRFKHGQKKFIEKENGLVVPNFDSKLVLWDVFGFFQQSFLKALDTFFSSDELAAMGYQQIKEGKDRRSSFTPDELLNFIVPYTQLEVQALVKLMERLNGYCKEADIYLKRWDGAGAVAAAILDKHHIKHYYGDIPDGVMNASQHAYGGGRNEMIQYGYGQKIFHKDIQSAYPAVTVDLPELASGHWIHLDAKHVLLPDLLGENNLSLYLIEWHYPDNLPFYPFFYRDIFGQITYPSCGINWVYGYELEKAIKWNHVLQGGIKIYEQWLYTTTSDVNPYAFVKDYYEKKRLYKSLGNGVYIVFKLGINSIYGKTVQHLGYDEETGRIPPYFQLQYGGAITSKTRATLFDAAMQHPESIIAMATDGIWSTQDLSLPCSEQLGEWDHELLRDASFIQSGVYFATKSNGNRIHHFRGFDSGSLSEETVFRHWQELQTHMYVPCTRFVTLGSALASDNRFEQKWCQWVTSMRRLVIHPCEGRKRINVYAWKKDNNPSMHLFPTLARNDEGKIAVLENTISYPFPLPWTQERKEYEIFKKGNREDEEMIREIEESLDYPGDIR